MVQGAVYDAVNMIDGGHEPYLDGLPPAPADASKAAAVATAAHRCAGRARDRRQCRRCRVTDYGDAGSRRVRRRRSRGACPRATPTRTRGDRSGCGRCGGDARRADDDGRYMPGSRSRAATIPASGGQRRRPRRPTRDDPLRWVRLRRPVRMGREGQAVHLKSTSQFRTKDRAAREQKYTQEYNEVKGLGGNGTTTPSARTPPSRRTWPRFFTANPVPMFNRTFRGLSTSEGLSLVEQARLFAMLDLSRRGCLRSTAGTTRRTGASGVRSRRSGSVTPTRTRRRSAMPTGRRSSRAPPYPDHPSGYNCSTGAFMHAAKAFFGNRTVVHADARRRRDRRVPTR